MTGRAPRAHTWGRNFAGIALSVSLVAFISQIACTDALKTVSKGIADTATAVGTIQTAVISANQQKLISDDETAQILTLCSKINTAGQSASKITRGYTTLTAANKPDLVAVINPILAAVNDALTNGLLPIKNQTVVQTIQTSLTVIKTALISIQGVIGG